MIPWTDTEALGGVQSLGEIFNQKNQMKIKRSSVKVLHYSETYTF